MRMKKKSMSKTLETKVPRKNWENLRNSKSKNIRLSTPLLYVKRIGRVMWVSVGLCTPREDLLMCTGSAGNS